MIFHFTAEEHEWTSPFASQKHMNIPYSFPTRSTWTFSNFQVETYEHTRSYCTRNIWTSFFIFHWKHKKKLPHFPPETHEQTSSSTSQKNKLHFLPETHEQTIILHQKHMKFHLPLKRHEQTSSWSTKNTWTNNFSPEKNWL